MTMSTFTQEDITINDGSEFKYGELFNSYDDVMERLAFHCKKSFVYYWRRDSKTVKYMKKKVHRPIEQRLVYFYVKFACVYGGQKFSSRGKGHRLSYSMRENCPAHITIRVNKDGKKLQVISVINTHNHPISKEIYEKLRQERQLSPALKSEVVDLLTIGVDKNLIKIYIQILSGKCLTRKDILNIGGSAKKSLECLGHKRICDLLNKFDDVVVGGYKLDNNKNLKALNNILYKTMKFDSSCEIPYNLESRVVSHKKIKCNKKVKKEKMMEYSEVKSETTDETLTCAVNAIDSDINDPFIDLEIDNEIIIYDNDIDYIIDENMEPVIQLDDAPTQNLNVTNDPTIVEACQTFNDIFTDSEDNECRDKIYCGVDNGGCNEKIADEIIPNIVKIDDGYESKTVNKNTTKKRNSTRLNKKPLEKISKPKSSKCIKKEKNSKIKSDNNEDRCSKCGRIYIKTNETIEEILQEREQLYKETATLYLKCESLKRELILERSKNKLPINRSRNPKKNN